MALAGLVADYTDSSGEEEEEHSTSTTKDKPSTDYFGTELSDSGDSDTNSQDVNESGSLPSPHFSSVLPNPLASSFKGSDESKGTVFGNKFANQEKAERAIFEKHVRMTEDQTSSRLLCFKFKRGACQKGKNCRFSHDLGFQAPLKVTEQDAETVESSESNRISEASIISNKKRIGITNTLLPAKKAKKSLDNQRANERPWTVHSQQ
ncbi:uncharacterized protein [Watersipora subatra]|uniref:uncharacterized protein n=1 Tax=Watersipora subatra TaxID=2589382 RepID=UPI00355BC2B5